ncbi:MAG TPA: hypothetical protein PK733_12700 [Clostridiales bacterium]|nr:hypothetical protein [Clostridiales bacterium]
MRRSENPLRFFVFIIVGAVLGGILGEILSQIQGLAWIKMGGVNGYRELLSFSFDPLINTNFLRFGLNLTIRVNFGNLVGIITGVILYLKT